MAVDTALLKAFERRLQAPVPQLAAAHAQCERRNTLLGEANRAAPARSRAAAPRANRQARR
jgi:hypothetical protein